MTFYKWFQECEFRNFKSHEFTRYFNRRLNETPPERLWKNVVKPLRILDDLRDAIGEPITITSSYRSPKYNASVGGAPRSQHLQFRALDFQIKNTPPHEAIKILKAWRASGMFKGGLGAYSTFTHIDTRGRNATWGNG